MAPGLVVAPTSAVLLHGDPVGLPGGGLLVWRTAVVPVSLVWDPASPFAVGVWFRERRRLVPWVIARELLAAGLLMPAGDGDVHIDPSADGLVVTLDNGRGERARFLFEDVDTVGRFLGCTYEQVRLGAERVDVDLELGGLIAGGER